MTIVVYVSKDDFQHPNPVLHSMTRQRYPITSTYIGVYRKGMQYANVYEEVYELSVADYLDLQNEVEKVYVLRYKGNKVLTLRALFMNLDYLDELGPHKDRPFAFWKRFWEAYGDTP